MLMPQRHLERRVQQEHRVVAAALAVGMLHAVDGTVLDGQPGAPVGPHLLGLALVLLGAVATAWAFPRQRPGLRSTLALVAGVLMLADGSMHVLAVARSSVHGSDLTGLLAAAAGATLLGLGVVIPVRHRGERHRSRRRRGVARVVAVLAGLAVAQYLLVPVVVAMTQTHTFHEDVGRPPSPAYQAVSFRSADGLQLAGWYRPSRNHAAVVVVSSSAGDRTGALRHAELLARHGYGVLVYDARGSGLSEGARNGWGWGWQDDVSGAVDFLASRPEVDAQRIGGLGLSTGADVLLEYAADHREMRAVVADGATARSFADARPTIVDAPAVAVTFAAGRVLSGEAPGRPLRELVTRAAPTPILLVASGSLAGELEFATRYAEAGPSTTLWKLPDVTHTNAVAEVPEAYERRVVAHLDEALG
jgi:hypothetical protein